MGAGMQFMREGDGLGWLIALLNPHIGSHVDPPTNTRNQDKGQTTTDHMQWLESDLQTKLPKFLFGEAARCDPFVVEEAVLPLEQSQKQKDQSTGK